MLTILSMTYFLLWSLTNYNVVIVPSSALLWQYTMCCRCAYSDRLLKLVRMAYKARKLCIHSAVSSGQQYHFGCIQLCNKASELLHEIVKHSDGTQTTTLTKVSICHPVLSLTLTWFGKCYVSNFKNCFPKYATLSDISLRDGYLFLYSNFSLTRSVYYLLCTLCMLANSGILMEFLPIIYCVDACRLFL